MLTVIDNVKLVEGRVFGVELVMLLLAQVTFVLDVIWKGLATVIALVASCHPLHTGAEVGAPSECQHGIPLAWLQADQGAHGCQDARCSSDGARTGASQKPGRQARCLGTKSKRATQDSRCRVPARVLDTAAAAPTPYA